jgi:hypothetical protein
MKEIILLVSSKFSCSNPCADLQVWRKMGTEVMLDSCEEDEAEGYLRAFVREY